MDTILFFYQTNAACDSALMPNITEFFLTDFKIVKIGLSKEAVMLIEQDCPFEEAQGQNMLARMAAGVIERIFGKLLQNRRRRKRLRKAQQQKEMLFSRILKYWGDECTTACVCRPPVMYFNKWRFAEYMDQIWIDRLLLWANLPYYVVIGGFSGLREILFPRARHMKELIIYVTERDRTDELEEIADELYYEYGLTPQIQIIQQNHYRGLERIEFMSCNVLDFSGESRMRPDIVPAGSRWFDFGNSDDKRRKIEYSGENILYFSIMDMFENPEKYMKK